jgi:hypothetical protein
VVQASIRAAAAEAVMRSIRFLALSCLFALFVLLFLVPGAHAQKWQPIPPEELALKEHPTAPGAPAIILFRDMFTDDVESYETHYYRVKVLTEEGRKQGDVEIVYRKGLTKISNIEARTIRPDGSAVPWDGKVFDKLLAKYKGTAWQTKTFTMPEVQVGSILEYRYRISWDPMILLPTFWVVQDDLFTSKANFRIKPYSEAGDPRRLMWVTSMLPQGQQPKEEKNGLIALSLQNVPAFEEEKYMPPERMLKMRVDFFYTFREKVEPPNEFWSRISKERHETIEQYIGKRSGILREAASLVLPTDTPEVKLRKIYARVQQIRNVSYESDKTEKEEKREKLKENNNVEDVLKRGYGHWWDINRLFVALARGAGLDAHVLLLGRRDEVFFNTNLVDTRQLNSEVALVRIDGKERFFDPGTRYCPFGLISWERSGVQALRLAKEGGTFVETTMFDSSNAQVRRKAELQLDLDGTIRGKVIATFTGQEALRRRLENLENDEVGRRKEVEDEIKEWLPSNTQVKLGSVTGWDATDEPLVAEADLEISGYASPTGRRLLLPLAPFQANEKHPFQHASRKYPVYFRHAFQELDEVSLKLPDGLRVDAVPPATNNQPGFGQYERAVSFDPQSRTLSWKRRMSIEGIFFRTEYYPMLRSFFNTVRQGDEQSLVLQADTSASR